jgi:hypothetical protein
MKTKYKKTKTKFTKERMRQFMVPEAMHQCLTEIVDHAQTLGFSLNNQNNNNCDYELLVHKQLSIGMTVGDFCLKCILTRWTY